MFEHHCIALWVYWKHQLQKSFNMLFRRWRLQGIEHQDVIMAHENPFELAKQQALEGFE